MKYFFILFFLTKTPWLFAQSDFLTLLQGTWKVRNEELYEHWDKVSENMLKGFSYDLKNGQMHISEYLDLIQSKKGMVYTATVLNQNQGKKVDFKLTQTNDTAFVFENPNHDFPKKIVYKKLSHAEIWIQISDNKQKTFSYTIIKVKED